MRSRTESGRGSQPELKAGEEDMMGQGSTGWRCSFTWFC